MLIILCQMLIPWMTVLACACTTCWSDVAWARQMHEVEDISVELLPSRQTHVCDSVTCQRTGVHWARPGTDVFRARIEVAMNTTHVVVVDHVVGLDQDEARYTLSSTTTRNATHVVRHITLDYHVRALVDARDTCTVPFPTTRDVCWCDKGWLVVTENYSFILRPVSATPTLTFTSPPADAGRTVSLVVTSLMRIGALWRYAMSSDGDPHVLVVVDIVPRGGHHKPRVAPSMTAVVGVLVEISIDEDVVLVSSPRTAYPSPTPLDAADARVFWVPVLSIGALCCVCVVFKCLCLARDAHALMYQAVPV